MHLTLQYPLIIRLVLQEHRLGNPVKLCTNEFDLDREQGKYALHTHQIVAHVVILPLKQ